VVARGELIGFLDAIRGWPDPATWAIGVLLLVPAARGQGVGAQVLEELEQRARDEGARRVRVGVARDSARARAFWVRQGYRPLDATADGEDPERLGKELG
jgi:GNAT superfamily N-acetyltransferase